MCNFDVLGFFHTKPIDWLGERLRNDLFCVEWNVRLDSLSLFCMWWVLVQSSLFVMFSCVHCGLVVTSITAVCRAHGQNPTADSS